MKAISPLIATVLLIGFAFSVGIILMSWLHGMGKEQSKYIEKAGKQAVKCTMGKFDIIKPSVKYNFSSNPPYINITVINTGKTDLYNFTFSVITEKNGVPNSYSFAVENQRAKNNPLKTGEVWTFNLIAKNNKPSSEEKISEIFISAICGKDYIIKNSVKFEG